ncbi:MAG: hypothetical protein ACRDP6_08075 [Actinoallomurus sp.]
MTMLEAGWAVWSKQAGRNTGYSIQACSRAPFDAAKFAAILRRYGLGTPSSTEAGPGALPWVTVSGFAMKGGAPYVGIMIETWTGLVDGVKRPISMTALFCVPYQAMCDAKVTYAALHHAAAAVRLPESGTDHGPVELQVPDRDIVALARDVEPDVRGCAEEAAGLLSLGQRITVVGADHLGLDDRLRFLDTVGAFLPYGYRAYATGATWTQGPAQRIRVAFGTRRREGTTALGWPSALPAEPALADSRYLSKLREMYAHDWTPEDVVDRLVTFTDPAKPDKPEYALETLTSLDWPFDLLRRSRRAEVEPAEIRRFFRTGRFGDLDPAGQVQALCYLIGRGGVHGWELAQPWLGTVAGDDAPEVREAVAEATRALLWRSDRRQDLEGYLQHADKCGFLDDLLGATVRPPDGAAPRTGMRCAARLLDDRVLASADLAAYPGTRAALIEAPAVACELIAHLVTGDELRRCDAVIDWLLPELEETLRPFLALWEGDAPPMNAADCDLVARDRPDGVLALLRTAARVERLEQVGPGFQEWLVGRAELTVADRRFWAAGLKELPRLSPAARGLLDPLFLAIGAFEAPITGTPWTEQEWSRYQQTFAQVWEVPWTSGNRARLVSGLAAYLAQCAWQRYDLSAEAMAGLVMKLLRIQDPALDWSGVLRGAYDAFAGIRDLPKQSNTAALLAWLRKNHRGLVREKARAVEPVEATRAPVPARSVEFLLDRLVELARRDPDRPQRVIGRLAAEGRPETAEDAVELVLSFGDRLTGSGFDPDRRDVWVDWLSERVCGGGFGAGLAEESAHLLRERVIAELSSRLGLLARTARRSRDGRARLTARQRERLDLVGDSMRDLLKEAGKNAPRQKRFKGGGLLVSKIDERPSARRPEEGPR